MIRFDMSAGKHAVNSRNIILISIQIQSKVVDSAHYFSDKPHVVKIYPKFGNSKTEGHRFIFLGIEIWEPDVFKFLNGNLGH
jgi:hypothetical protein